MKEHHVEETIIAMLAVNNYPLEKVWSLLPGLRDAGLTRPDTIPDDIGDVTVRLASAGYDRGMLTSMFAERIAALMEALRSGALAGLDGLIEDGSKAEAIERICTVRGVGPRVAQTAWSLWTS